MADDYVSPKKQSLSEIRRWDFDFNNDLVTGVTVSSATATHLPPNGGTATTPTVGSISSGVVPVVLGPVTGLGVHTLVILATLSDGEKSEIRIGIRVDY